jgi:hypothetical protein
MTALTIFFVPVFFVTVLHLFRRAHGDCLTKSDQPQLSRLKLPNQRYDRREFDPPKPCFSISRVALVRLFPADSVSRRRLAIRLCTRAAMAKP